MTIFYAILCLAIAGLLLFYTLGRVVENKSPFFRALFPMKEKIRPSWDWTDAAVIGLLFFFLPPFLFAFVRSAPESFFHGLTTIQPDALPPSFSLADDSTSTAGSKTPGAARRNLRLVYNDAGEAERLADEHPLTRLLFLLSGSDRFIPVLLLCFLAGVVAAPLVEEFVFRIVFQGALEALFFPADAVPGSLTPRQQSFRASTVILLPAILFALIHWRGAGQIETLGDLDDLLTGIAVTPIALTLTGLAALLWLWKVRGATPRRLGWVGSEWRRDFLRGVGVFALFLPIMLLLGAALPVFFPKNTVLDPIPIFILAILLGLLAWRTGRFAAVVGAHMALNGFSFLGILILIYCGKQ